jgi:hypothetical protein
MAEAPTIYTGRDGKTVRVWVCSVCGRTFEWGFGAEWFGSDKEAEDRDWDRITVVCGLLCKLDLADKGVRLR